MASIPAGESDIGIGMGATWDTARDLTLSNVGKALQCSSFKPSGGFDQFQSANIGNDLYPVAINRGAFNGSLAISGEQTFSGMWLQLLAAFMGTATAVPAEQTGSQGDYLHNLDMASRNTGRYLTLAYKIEDDYALEFPSYQLASFGMDFPINKPATFDCGGLFSRVIDSPTPTTNTAAELAALSYPTEDTAVYGNTNHYFRINTQSGSGLAGGDNLLVNDVKISLTRKLTPRQVLNGANTPYTKEPDQFGRIEGTLEFTLTQIDDSTIAGITKWLAGSEMKAELLIDGALIGSTLNRGYKLQFPRMKISGDMPGGHDFGSNASGMRPTYKFDLMAATAAPTGMTGVTAMMRAAVTSTRVQSFFN